MQIVFQHEKRLDVWDRSAVVDKIQAMKTESLNVKLKIISLKPDELAKQMQSVDEWKKFIVNCNANGLGC